MGGIIIGVVALARWAYALQGTNNPNSNTTKTSGISSISSNVSNVEGKQIITILAWNGKYDPKTTTAKAGMPTSIKLQGKNAYGCESAVRIPSIQYAKNLDPNGSDTVEIPAQTPWSTIDGTCSMGMYRFQVKFE